MRFELKGILTSVTDVEDVGKNNLQIFYAIVKRTWMYEEEVQTAQYVIKVFPKENKNTHEQISKLIGSKVIVNCSWSTGSYLNRDQQIQYIQNINLNNIQENLTATKKNEDAEIIQPKPEPKKENIQKITPSENIEKDEVQAGYGESDDLPF